MANSTTIIADFTTAIASTPGATTVANAVNPSGPASTTATTNVTNGGSGVYASGTYYGGLMDYAGTLNLLKLKAQEIAVLLTRLVANTDQSTDATLNALLVKILNDFQ